MPQDYILTRLLAHNAHWAHEIVVTHPHLLPMTTQSPKVLWLGCADSRVPESVITESLPGEIFVHRNIANQFLDGDDSALAVLTYAVLKLEVSHVVVVGHERCGGVEAAYDAAHHQQASGTSTANSHAGPLPEVLTRWLGALTKLAHEHPDADVPELTELSVKEQVRKIAESDVVKGTWQGAGAAGVRVHGWVFDVDNGRLRDLGVSTEKLAE